MACLGSAHACRLWLLVFACRQNSTHRTIRSPTVYGNLHIYTMPEDMNCLKIVLAKHSCWLWHHVLSYEMLLSGTYQLKQQRWMGKRAKFPRSRDTKAFSMWNRYGRTISSKVLVRTYVTPFPCRRLTTSREGGLYIRERKITL